MDELDTRVAAQAPTAGARNDAHTRGARRKSETRRRLLHAARAVFAREGLEAATIAQITHAADVGFGTFYLHFATKEEAFRAVVTEGFGELAREVTRVRLAAQERGDTWWEIVRVSVRAYCIFAERHRELFQVMFAGGSAGIGLGRSLQEQFADQMAAQLMDEGRAACDQGLPAPYPYPSARVAALASVVALTRSTLWWLASADEADSADSADAADDTRDASAVDAALAHEPRPTLDELVETLTRYITAALWGQTPSA